jgi:methionine sulfoxide reductase catalytic subunit
MVVHRNRPWDLPERQATPRAALLGRRASLRAGAAGVVAGVVSAALGDAPAMADNVFLADGGYVPPASADRFPPGRVLSAPQAVESFNNFYEFGLSKNIAGIAQQMSVSPWPIRIDGLVEKPFTIDVADLIGQMAIETRVYRHRCVEAWAMTVPWMGFSMASLVKLAAPLGSAKFVRFQSLADSKTMPGLAVPFFPWPYTEGLTIAEATSELAFVATGLYGAPMPKQDGAPIRIVLPWKYGFKSAKSIVRISFVASQPKTFWQATSPTEYGFWANVNPKFPHPRWSQARERLIGTDEIVPTMIYNGYGEWAAPLYAGMQQDRSLFM